MEYRSPAKLVTDMFGVRPLARDLGVSPSTVLMWRKTTGNIPSKHHILLIEMSDGRLDTDDLVYGRD